MADSGAGVVAGGEGGVAEDVLHVSKSAVVVVVVEAKGDDAAFFLWTGSNKVGVVSGRATALDVDV